MPNASEYAEQSAQHRLETLEFRVAFQDDLLETLNRQVADQQAVIQQLRRALEQLHEQIRPMQNNQTDILDDVPPHY